MMDIQGGYTGKILRVDLTRKTSEIESLSLDLVRNFRGGAGINAALAYKELEKFGDPLSPENKMIFGLGPLVGTIVPGAGKGNLTTRSPHRKFIGISGHGLFGMLKFAGFDHLVISGQAETPTLLKIEDNRVSFLDADTLWGLDVFDTTDRVWERLGDRFHVTCIGPAGENLVRDSSMITNKYATFARTGTGAVMGSKNLKALAIHGSGGIAVADKNRFLKAVKKVYQILRADPNLLNWRKYGTLISMEIFSQLGLYASKNYQSAFHEDLLDRFPVDEFVDTLKKADLACQACPVGCKHHLNFDSIGENGSGLAVSCMNSVMQAFGNFCLVNGWKEAVRCAEIAARMGLDFVSVGSLISFVFELYDRGLIKDKDTGGQPLRWGDGKVIRDLTRKIALREGLGEVLADGIEHAVKTLGPETAPYAMHSKGLGILYDPRVRLESTEIFSQFTNVRGYVSNVSISMVERTPDQIRRYCSRIGLSPDAIDRIVSSDGYNVGRLNKWTEDVTSVLEILGICMFPPYQRLSLDLWAEIYSATTGIETSRKDLIAAAENMWNVRRAYNLREGASHLDDICPERFFKEPISVGSRRLEPLDKSRFLELVRSYYEERGWDPETGKPPFEKLVGVGILG